MHNNHLQTNRFRNNDGFLRPLPELYEQTVTTTMTTTVNKEVNATVDETTTTELEKGPLRRVTLINGPNSAFARLFPERYREEQEEFRRQQRSKSSSDDTRYNFDRIEPSPRSHRVTFADEQQWRDIDGRTRSEPHLNENLAQHVLNHDPEPEVIYRDNPEKLVYVQKVGVRYLKPPTPPPPGPLVIREVQPTPPVELPPLIVGTTPPETPRTPSPMIVRERPPTPPEPQPPTVITKKLPAQPTPPRRVIIKRVPPLPAKPRPIIIEKWLPYKNPPERQVVYQRAEPREQVRSQNRNVIVQYEQARVRVEQEVQNVGCFRVDPEIYRAQFGSSLRRTDSIRRVLEKVGCNPDIITVSGYQTEGRSTNRFAHPRSNLTCFTDQQIQDLLSTASSTNRIQYAMSGNPEVAKTTRDHHYSSMLTNV